ncbi:MAG: hypothetical protein GY711_17250 [bacterium]|nr:hypothetical protein [bacterium]
MIAPTPDAMGSAVAGGRAFFGGGWTGGPGLALQASDRVDIFNAGPIVMNYCGPAVPNSSGASATIRAETGPPGPVLLLVAENLPQNQLGIFLAGQTQGMLQPPLSNGVVCLAGNIGRFNEPQQVGQSGAQGRFELDVDLSNIPVNPPTAVVPGDTWHFQAWFRDLDPGPTSNFTDGVSVTLF